MTFVARARALTGQTQAQFAARVGTSRTRLSAYENGHTLPELDTLERIAFAADAELCLAPRGTERVRRQFIEIYDAIGRDDAPWALRLVAELIGWVRDGVVSVHCLQRDPALCGDRRWDALVGGVAEMLCTEFDETVPGWASGPGRVVDGVWFFSSLQSLRPHILISAPAALAARGVLVSAESLASV
jgi:transcriptional regulator with XRE-family HTH domain